MKKILILFLEAVPFVLVASDSTFIRVIIYHGSVPAEKGGYRSIGGKFGGHVVMEIGSFYYGFNFRGSRIHVFPRNGDLANGIYEKIPVASENYFSGTKTTVVVIPVTRVQKMLLTEELELRLRSSPHDYAFFGMRCASTCYYFLGKAGFFKESGYFLSILKAFHPRALRKKVVRKAEKTGREMIVHPGSQDRHWEGDRSCFFYHH